jgi:hypothetical protein
VTVDAAGPSRLLLAAQRGAAGGGGGAAGGVFALATRYDRVELANRRQVEAVFRTPGWEEALVRLR